MKISEIVREMSPPRYTTAQAAALVGRSEDTLKRWRKTGVFVPTEIQKFGKVQVHLYTREDIAELKRLARMQRVRVSQDD